MEHYITECQKTKDWFTELGKDKDKILEEIWDEDLDDSKGRVLKKLWKEKEIKKRRIIRERGER